MLKTRFLLLLSLSIAYLTAQPIVPCKQNRSDHRKAYIAACMMFQNEARYLEEWLEFHKCIGITHFYLYNNASTDEFWDVLEPYVASGEVELFELKEETPNCQAHNNLQREAYNHALKLAKKSNEWLAILDSDEFICMTKEKNLKRFLKSYLDVAGIAINWVMYGSSGVEKLGRDELQIERFVYRAPDNWNENFLVKSIVRPSFVERANIHICDYKPPFAAVFPNHHRFSHTPGYTTPPIEEIRINHYWWRDEEYFRTVKVPRRAKWGAGFTQKTIMERRDIYNSVYDFSMKPFVEKTKSMIRKRHQ